jgi:nucleoside-diphosphate-sugar epimerase
MKVFITGASGFIGNDFVMSLLNEGTYKVGVLARKTSSHEFSQSVTVFQYDHTIDSIIGALANYKPDVVVHLATYYSFNSSNEELGKLIDSNILFGTQLSEAMVQTGSRKLINVGTSFEHYLNQEYNPVNLYAATKFAFQKILDFYSNSGLIEIVTLKLFDTYGDHDTRKKLLWYLRECISSDTSIDLSPGDQLLDLLHIDDICAGLIVAINHIKQNIITSHEQYALSSSRLISLKQLVEIIEGVTGKELQVNWGAKSYRSREVMKPWTSFNFLPKWKSKVQLETGLVNYFGNKEGGSNEK